MRLAPNRWWLILGGAFVVGVVLRLYLLPGQILLDDEWHSLFFVPNKPWWSLFIDQNFTANCIPQNVYNRVMLGTLGWSELILRMPSILAGILGLIVFPVLVARLSSRFVAAVFAWLLAISPCAVFYSRFARPYAVVMFLGFLALLSLLLWLKEGRRRFLLTYVVAGFGAFYCHLYAVLHVLTPLAALWLLLGLKQLRMRFLRLEPLPSPKALGTACLLIGGLGCLFLLPPTLKNPFWLRYAGSGVDHATWTSLANYLSLLSGVANLPLKLIFAGLLGLGLGRWLREDRVMGIILATIFAAHLVSVWVSTQPGIHAAIQIARYGIILFPASFLLVALGLEKLLSQTGSWKALSSAIACALIAALFLAGPLRRTYQSPNNFTNHSAFQDSYAPPDWSRSHIGDLVPVAAKQRQDLPPFYTRALALPAADGLIEFPMFAGDGFNFYYYYQLIHRKQVAAGYLPDIRTDFPSPTIYGDVLIDFVLNPAAWTAGRGLHFRNLAPLSRLPFVRQKFKNWIVVVHKDVCREFVPPRYAEDERTQAVYQRLSRDLIPYLAADLGKPVYEDEEIAAWWIY